MTRGTRTPDNVEANFRAKYLLSGNASAAARAIGIPETTGAELARRAQADPVFVKARAELYASALGDVERMMLEVTQICRNRVEEINELEMQDPRPQYAAQVVAAYKALGIHRKIQAELERDKNENPAQVVVNVRMKEADVDVENADDRPGTKPAAE